MVAGVDAAAGANGSGGGFGALVARVGGALLQGLAGGPVGAVASVASAVSGAPAGDPFKLLQLQKEQSLEYLSLQNEMQRESREYSALSNLIKVRHESARAAISNLR
jgi:hypothetical protein